MVTRVGGGPLAFYKMVAMPFEFDGVPVTDLDGTPVATLRFGIPGLDLSFSRPVTVRMQVGSEYDGYLVQIQSLTETGEAWTDETTAKVRNGQVEFTVSHATRFAASAAGGRVASGLATQGAAHHAAHRARRRLRHAPRPQRGAVRRPRHQGLRRLDVHLLPLRHPPVGQARALQGRAPRQRGHHQPRALHGHAALGSLRSPAARSGPTSLKPAARA